MTPMPESEHAAPRVIITGAARRVGRATALHFARAGCDIDFTYRTSKRDADDLVAAIRALGRHASATQLDLDDLDAVTAFASSIAAQGRAVDVLVHNASLYMPTPIDALDIDAAQQHMRINALAPLALTAGLADAMRRSTRPVRPAVVAMLDIHATGASSRPRQRFSAYAMSKAALCEMVRTLAVELAPDIRVNGVAPGVVAFPESGYESDAEMQARYLARVPLQRSGTPEEAAEAIRWLALDASYCTGQIIKVDGGRELT